MKQKKMIRRVLLLGLAVLMLCVSLVACGSETMTNYEWTAADADAIIYFSRILPQNADAHEKFIAASRGYNMSDPNFDDSKVELGVVLPVDVEAAKLALDGVKPTQDASVLMFNQYRDALTAEQVTEIVNRMRAVNTVDLTETGFPGIILVWIGKFLGLFGNYVFALFVFAIIIEVLLLYFGIRQQKNSIKQAKLSPKERAIRKKYAGRNDQVSMRKMQEEIQKLYQEEGFNPMGGCLPLLIQMPIVIALYNIVIDPLRYVLGKPAGLSAALSTFATTSRAAGGLGETLANSGRGSIELLSKLSPENLTHLSNFSYFSNSADCAKALEGVTVPDFSLFGLNMGLTPSFNPVDKVQLWLLLIPVLTFAAYFASMKLNRKFSYQPAVQDPQMGCSNNMMDITMPLMSVYITFITPAAVGVYWIFKCIVGVVKQFILHKVMPLPTFTEEDYKKAEKEVKAKSKGKRETIYVSAADGAKYRSLHHIDDDDDLPPKGMVQAPATRDDEETEDAPVAEQAPDDGRPALKEDRKNKDKK